MSERSERIGNAAAPLRGAAPEGGAPGSEVVVHVGLPVVGASVSRALSDLRPQLRSRGVGVVTRRQLAQGKLGKATTFETVLVSSDALTGAEVVGPTDAERFRPEAEAAVTGMLEAVGRPARLVLFTLRQDLLMEVSYVKAVQDGVAHDLADQFPWLAARRPQLDYAGLVERLEALPGVEGVSVRPFEATGGDPHAYVEAVLDEVGLAGQLDLSVVRERLAPRIYTKRALSIARALNGYLTEDRQRDDVRRYLLRRFPPARYRRAVAFSRRERFAVVRTYRRHNAELFRRYGADGIKPGVYSSRFPRGWDTYQPTPPEQRDPVARALKRVTSPVRRVLWSVRS